MFSQTIKWSYITHNFFEFFYLMQKISLAIHGGAGTIDKAHMTSDKEQDYRRALAEILKAGYALLKRKASALDVVEKTVNMLEDYPLFNAGKGSVFNHKGKHEMDASLMCGKTLKAGAVAGVANIKNPISLARAVMERSEFVMLSGAGAAEFARTVGFSIEKDDYFFTKERYDQLLHIQDTPHTQLDHAANKPIGTVGAVALDAAGNVAAATSTGGMTNKRFGRVGDTPIIGAGTYANNRTCAVSSTGHGEYFIRTVAAYDISCLMEYGGYSLQQACERVVMEKLVSMGGEGGAIAVDCSGNISMVFNSPGMYRGAIAHNQPLFTAIYED